MYKDIISKLNIPDLLTDKSGNPVLDLLSWEKRRSEILTDLQKYE